MIEVLKQLLVPGGVLTGLVTWWLTSHTKKDDTKTEVTAQRKEESKQIVAASGIEERWQALFDSANESFNLQLAQQGAQLREAQASILSLQRREGVHYEYHFALRGQVQDLGATPHKWPPEIDPMMR